MKLSKAALANLVDALGKIKAEAADLADAENAIKAKLIKAGVTEADGELFRATISESERETRDTAFKKLIDQLVERNTTPQYRAAHTTRTAVIAVRVVARVQKDKAA